MVTRMLQQAGYRQHYALAVAYIGLGRIDEAFEALDVACLDRDPLLSHIAVEPRFDHLRGDPRFGELLTADGAVYRSSPFCRRIGVAPALTSDAISARAAAGSAAAAPTAAAKVTSLRNSAGSGPTSSMPGAGKISLTRVMSRSASPAFTRAIDRSEPCSSIVLAFTASAIPSDATSPRCADGSRRCPRR